MAKPILEIYDAGGTLIPEGVPISFTSVVPGVPSAETLFSVRNNFGGGSPVDTAPNTTVRGLSRAAGDSSDPQLAGSTFQDDRASRLRVISVSGGATAPLTDFRPAGAGNVIVLDEIPDGGIVNMGWRIEATSAAALADVDARLSIEPRLAIALAAGEFEARGNYVLDGVPGGVADPLFSEIFEETGDWLPNIVPDDTINTPTLATYTLQGTPETFFPVTPEITFNDEDGASMPLLIGEVYPAILSYDAGGVVTVTKGLKVTAPFTDADVPTGIPGIDRVLVTVPFGLLIDTLELRGDFGFFHTREVGGLDVAISGGQGTSAGFLVIRQTETTLQLPDDEVSTLWQLPNGGLEATLEGTFSASEPRALELYDYTTAAGVITLTIDNRRLGNLAPAAVEAPITGTMGFANPGGGGGPHIIITAPGVFTGWTNATTLVVSGGIVADPLADQSGTPSASFTVPFDGWYELITDVNGFTDAQGAGDVIIGKLFVNDIEPAPTTEFTLQNLSPDLSTTHSNNLLAAGDEIDVRLTNSTGNGSTNISLISFLMIVKLNVRT